MTRSRLICWALCAALLGSTQASAGAADIPSATFVGGTTDHLRGPGRMALDSRGVLYVADAQNRGIVKFDTSGRFLGTIAVTGVVRGVALTAEDRIVVSHDAAVTLYGSDGAPLADFSGYPFQSPSGIAVAPSGTIYVADSKAHQVARFDAGGAFLSAFGGKGSGQGQFNFPTAVAYESASDQVVVADTLNNRIQFFDPAGTFKRALGSPAQLAGPLKFTYPDGIAFDHQNGTRLYVADGFQSSVQVIDLGAVPRFLAYIGSYGSTDGLLQHPSDVLFDEANSELLVADSAGKINIYAIGAAPSSGAPDSGGANSGGANGGGAASGSAPGAGGTPGSVGTVGSIGSDAGITRGSATWQYPAGVDCRHARVGSIVCR